MLYMYYMDGYEYTYKKVGNRLLLVGHAYIIAKKKRRFMTHPVSLYESSDAEDAKLCLL